MYCKHITNAVNPFCDCILGLVSKDNNDSIHNNYLVSDAIISGMFSHVY